MAGSRRPTKQAFAPAGRTGAAKAPTASGRSGAVARAGDGGGRGAAAGRAGGRRPSDSAAVGAVPVGAPVTKKGRLTKIRDTGKQLVEVLKITYSTDRALPLWLLGAFLPLPVIGFLVGFSIGGTGSTVYYTVIGAFLGILAALIVFGRRAETAAYARLGDSPGAAAAALNTLKKNWTVEPGIGGTRTLEVVHRAVGRPGIVLVGEGASDTRLRELLAGEVRRHARVAPDTPIKTIMAGATPGRAPVRSLPGQLGKLPKVLSGSDVSELNRRLKALGLGLPKMPGGPLPKGARLPKGLRQPPEPASGAGPKNR